MPCKIFLISGRDVLGGRNCLKLRFSSVGVRQVSVACDRVSVFQGAMPLGCDPHKCFSVLFSTSGGTGWLLGLELGVSLPPGLLGSDDTPAG